MHYLMESAGWFHSFYVSPPWYISPIKTVLTFCAGIAGTLFVQLLNRQQKTHELRDKHSTLRNELGHQKQVIVEIGQVTLQGHSQCIKRLKPELIEEARLNWFQGESQEFQNALAHVASNIKVLNDQLDQHAALWESMPAQRAHAVPPAIVQKEMVLGQAMIGTEKSIDALLKIMNSSKRK
jgi:hypothetical protein